MRRLTVLFAPIALFITIPASTFSEPAWREQDPAAENVLTVEELLRRPVRSESGDVAGEIEELIIDRGGSVRLVVVELLEPERKTVAIPWSYLAVREDGSIWLSASESDLLRAPAFPAQVSNVAPRPETTSAASASAIQATFNPSPTPVARFQPSSIKSYRGLVVGTMTAPLEGTINEVVAIIDIGDEEVEAHLGPQPFLEKIGLEIEPGVNVVFEGSPSEVEETTVVVVSRITVRDRTSLLRERDGTPRWR
ncbi:MAG: PRC-barrel domain-containing protein [Vicinamibacteria bacterium]